MATTGGKRMNDRFNIRYFNKNTKKFEYLKIGAVNFNLFTDWTVYEQGQFCTGLKDKNGKLIYEGDIVKMPFLEPILNYMPSDKNTEFAKIEEFKGCFTIFYLDKSHRTYLYQWNNQIEVIGNIYENKSLLESEG
jgi:uncharacterized phage protein (TIGR01671 family)